MITFKHFLQESPASDSAKRLGLKYYGFGRYGKNKRVTHHSEFGYLRKVKNDYHPDKGETPLLHLEHVEDEIFNNGVFGVRNAINYLHGIEALMKGHDDRVKLVTKIDGSPSLTFSGSVNPWVSTKSAFNATPKLNFSNEDIEANHGHAPGLVKKLKAALQHIHKLKTVSPLQGDLLFTKEDVNKEMIDGVLYYTFKPNTIRYAIPVDSEMGKEVSRAKIGLAIHTKYHDFDKPERVPASLNDYTKHPDIFVLPIEVSNANVDVSNHISYLGKLLSRTKREVFQYAQDNATTFKQYINATVRSKTTPLTDDFLEWYATSARKQIAKLKSERGQAEKRMKLDMELDSIRRNKELIYDIFKIHTEIQNVKNNIIDTLDTEQKIKQFYETPEGMQETTPEGYVVIGATGSLKLVRRHSFSAMNFTKTMKSKT